MKRLGRLILATLVMAGSISYAIGRDKYVVNHKGRDICVAATAVAAHLAHGDGYDGTTCN